jgi:hypothetical protein
MDEQKKFHNMLKDMMYSVAQRRTNFTAICHVMLGLITAPLMTLSMSLQVSLPKNRVTFDDFKPKTDKVPSVTQMRFSNLTDVKNAAI